ncbi:ATP-binding cassette domain-containing protein [Candidatus Woesearchaeota archaeon]|jgi:ABC-2 type transport system ATP-binding protein|nr:ATP-binding cassette domain-containing protein [Candidatus Woesearchaeota archaeon]MBT4114164.1 ATP-binding cassette domain-containing protein [Candidatus Woesearchaeota archaeon]MBT4248393.1 ATP-binding cassette domain-containing protein [Candidatus Woesearchaeota archaeon]
METAIKVSGLAKEYKTYSREESFRASIRSLFKRDFKIKHALKGIDFEIKTGEVIGLIGPNGAGKSTAIKVLCGVLYPTSGEVKSLGYVPWKQRQEYAYNFGVVFGQKSQLAWDIPPNDTYHLLKVLYDIPEETFKRRLAHMVKLLSLEDIYKRPTRGLSLGERMKCEVVAALLHKPKLVLLDEPTIGMDVVAKKQLHNFIKQINKDYNTTFIITTHDMQDIEKLCKRVIIINTGDIVYDGPLADLCKKYVTNKLIEVRFEEKTHVSLPKRCTLIDKTPYTIKFEVPLKNNKLDPFVAKLVGEYPVADITISDPDIEEIIRDIYQHGTR